MAKDVKRALMIARDQRVDGNGGVNQLYHRRTNSTVDQNGTVGHMMFAADEDRVSHYGKNHYTLDLKHLHPKHVVDAASPAFQRAVKKALLEAPELLEQFGAGKEQSAQALAAQLAAETAPRDIVDSAGLWDAPELVSHVWDKVIEPNGWRAVKTPNGAISFYSEDTKAAAPSRYAEGGAVENKDVRRALMIARDQRALLRRVANIYPGPGGGMDPSPGGGGYSGPGGGKYIGPSHYAEGGSVPPFKLYSGAAKIIGAKGQAKATPQQYAAMPGIKPDELKHSNFDTLGSKALPREEVIKHLEDNALPLEETRYTGDDKQSALRRYGEEKTALPGGQNYREVLLHTPGGEEHKRARLNALADQGDALLKGRSVVQLTPEERAKWADLERQHNAIADADDEYKGSHWDQPNVLAHVRMSDRKGPNGEKVLHVEEVQSDWGQQGRDQGFARDPEDLKQATKARDDYVAGLPARVRAEIDRRIEKARSAGTPVDTVTADQIVEELTQDPFGAARFLGETDKHNEMRNAAMPSRDLKPQIPRGPYVDNTQKWTDLALKRVLHEAAHGGYDKIVVTPGDEQNKRYDLSSHVKNIRYYPDTKYLGATTHDNRGVEHEGVEPDDLAKHIGKEAADRILKQPLQRFEGRGKLGGEFYHELEGDGLKVGGAGMRGYYDNILPKRLQALAQQHDPQAKVNLHAHEMQSSRPFEELTDEERDDLVTPSNYRPSTTDVSRLHSLDVTPQMRDSIKANGFNSFKRGGRAGYTPGGGVEQLQQNLHQSFSDLNRQVAAQGPQQQQQAMPQAPYGAYQRMERQATGQAPNDAYQRMMAQALNGKTYEEMFPAQAPYTPPPPPAPAPEAPAAQAVAEPFAFDYGVGPQGDKQGGRVSPTEAQKHAGNLKRGGRATNLVERALAITRRK